MSYPRNAKEVLRLEGLHFARILLIVQFCAIIYLITQTNRLSEAQFWAIPQPIRLCAILVVITSFFIVLTMLTISVKRTYERYNEKAQFELMLRGLLTLVASSSNIPTEAKRPFAYEYLDLLTSDVAREHLIHLPNGPGKQLLQETILVMLKETGTRLVQQVEKNNGIPSSCGVSNINTDLTRLEELHEALYQ